MKTQTDFYKTPKVSVSYIQMESSIMVAASVLPSNVPQVEDYESVSTSDIVIEI